MKFIINPYVITLLKIPYTIIKNYNHPKPQSPKNTISFHINPKFYFTIFKVQKPNPKTKFQVQNRKPMILY